MCHCAALLRLRPGRDLGSTAAEHPWTGCRSGPLLWGARPFSPQVPRDRKELRGFCLNSLEGRHLDRGVPCTCHGLVSSPEDSRFIRSACSPAKPRNSAKKHLSFKPQRTSSLPSQAKKISSLSLKPYFGYILPLFLNGSF